MVDPEVIEETGKALARFDHFELVMIVALIIAVALIFILGPKWLDKRYEVKLADINTQNKQLDAENNALIKEISGRLTGLEYNVSEVMLKLGEIEKLKVSQKMLARDVLRSNITNEKLDKMTRLEAARDYLKLGGDGNLMGPIIELAVSDKELWNHVKDEDSGRYVDAESAEYYRMALEKINRFVVGV